MPVSQRRLLEEALQRYADHPSFEGVDLTAADQGGGDGDTPLHIAIRLGNLEDARLFLEHGANVNKQGDIGYTALHNASMQSNAAAVRLLLEHGANCDVKSDFGETAIGLAVRQGDIDIIELLAEFQERRPQ